MEAQPMLQVIDLTVQFGSLLAVNNVNMQIHQGAIAGLIGPNGAGKTTLFNAIIGIYPPQKGKVIFKGVNITHLLPHKICQLGMSRTFQVIRAFNHMTVEETVRVGGYNRHNEQTIHTKVDEMVEICELKDLRTRMCGDLGLALLRRVELARALATEPELLLLDEAGAGLNATELSSFMDLLKKINKEYSITLCVVEHVMQMVMGICDRITVLDSGEVIATGSPMEIRKNEKVIEAYLGKRALPC